MNLAQLLEQLPAKGMLPVHRTDLRQQADLLALCCGTDEAGPPPLVELPPALLYPSRIC